MNVETCTDPDGECDAFVRRQSSAKLCHLYAWAETIGQLFGHKSFYLVARRDGVIRGVLPLSLVRSRLFGNRMISQAFSNYGGPLTETPEASQALYDRAVELSIEHRCESMELRNLEPLPFDLHQRTDKITMILPLAPDPAEIFRGLRHKTRNRIRKAERADLVVIDGGVEMLADFYRIWTLRMHQLGTPCYPRRLFSAIATTFAPNCRIFLARLKDVTVGGLFVYCFAGLVQSRWGAVLTEYNDLSPNYLLNWAAMKYFSQAGATRFDFGRSTVGSGQHEFKKRWGAQEIPLPYQYWTPPGRSLSVARPDSPKYRAKVQMWKKLPLAMTRLAGPYISRSLP